MILLPLFFGSGSHAQDGGSKSVTVDRKPAVAGQFYPSDPVRLRTGLSALFAAAQPCETKNTVAIISPHAGYVFSGEVAASAFNQIDPDKNYDNIFILASSHRMSFDGASVYTRGDYITPLGAVKVNRELASSLVKENPVFTDVPDAHLYEHSLEVQLPFLQYRMKTEFRIIPIVLGTQSAASANKIAQALKPYLNDRNLFIISTDFSHYPEYDDACLVDNATAGAIIKNSPEHLLKVLEENDRKGIDDLATSLCGWTSVVTLLYMTEERSDLIYREIKYMNSGDSPLYGDKDRVVGYFAIAVEQSSLSKQNDSFSLNEEERKLLLQIARQTMEQYVSKGKVPPLDEKDLPARLRELSGAFVTLKKEGQLRGCIGRFEATSPLYDVVQQMAVASSTQDSRFEPVETDEFDDIDIEISVLSPMRKISSVDEIVLGKHGIYMKKGFYSGTFLPQVATETGWTLKEFLGHCARDKARIGWDGWKTAELFVYEAYVFGEKE